MAYTTINKSTDYFNTKLYTGTGSSNALTGVGFQPDWTWIKVRSEANNHELYDSVRGVTKRIYSDLTNAEDTNTAGLTAFGTDGFTVGTGGAVNGSSKTYVAWNWRAGAGAGSSNADGTITSTVSANTTAGFSIVKYTGTGANATIGHGLGVAPKVIIVKNLESSYEWIIGHADLDTNQTGFSDNWYFNGFGTGPGNQNATASWNSTNPTTSVFSLHSSATYMNASGESNIAYCFAEKTGFSKFGKYIGNGSTDGTFVYTGFKPAFVMLKYALPTSGVGNWGIHDGVRDIDNPVKKGLLANTNAAEDTHDFMDMLSNGFKLKSTSSNRNESGSTYVYMAFAEAPLVGSNNIPATAR